MPVKKSIFLKRSLLSILIILFLPLSSGSVAGSSLKTIAIIPFETNTENDLSYMTAGITTMLESRLFWKDNVAILQQPLIHKALSGIKEMYESNAVFKIGEKTGADYVITGIITEFAGAYSIDTKVWNLKEKSYLTFYDQSPTLDKLISRVDIVAAKINKKIFDRTTVSYEKFKKEKFITEEDLRRMNPERMMPVQEPGERKKPWWKIW
jgi:TolB-like protein